MAAPRPTRVGDDDVYSSTEKGLRELKSADTQLTATELEVLVLMDGFSPVGEIAHYIPGVSRAELGAVIGRLVDAKYAVSMAEPDADVMGSGFSTISIPAGFFSGLTDTTAQTNSGVSILKKKGFYVRIAKRAAEARTAQPGWKPTVLVIEDDPDVQKLIRTYFTMEGFTHRAAFKAADVVIALRQQPQPDLILLDVNLPDGNGFDILARMRQHPVLKTMPVVMLTAETTREAVLKGLTAGADGYLTKPFEPDVLVTAVKSVLGIGLPAAAATKPAK
jgi:CheY-like chemotaxis protein